MIEEQTNSQAQQLISPINFNSGNMVQMTSLNNELKRLEESLRGVQTTFSGEPIQTGNRLLNEKGIRTVVGQVASIVNTNTVMSNLDEQNISSLSIGLLDDLIKTLMMNKDAFEIKSDEARSAILSRCINLALITLKRGYKGDDKRFWKGTVSEINYGTSGVQPQKQSMLSRFAPSKWLG